MLVLIMLVVKIIHLVVFCIAAIASSINALALLLYRKSVHKDTSRKDLICEAIPRFVIFAILFFAFTLYTDTFGWVMTLQGFERAGQ